MACIGAEGTRPGRGLEGHGEVRGLVEVRGAVGCARRTRQRVEVLGLGGIADRLDIRRGLAKEFWFNGLGV